MKGKSLFLKIAFASFLVIIVGLLALVNVNMDSSIQETRNLVQAADDDKGGDEDKKTEDKKIKQSYASKLFDASKSKNQSLMYFDKQTNSGAPTVESIIKDKTKGGNGEAYAAFLKTQNKWNLYNTYTSQLDTGTGVIGAIIKWTVGGTLLLCLYIMDAIDGFIKILAELLDYLNIFKYMSDGSGNIPESNPFHVLQPIVDIYKGISVFAKLFIALSLGFVLFMIGLGIGPTRRSKGSYFGRKVGKLLLGLASLALLPFILSAYFGLISDIFTSGGNFAKSSINSKPADYIVDNRSYIDASLTAVKNEKNNGALNDGYVLNHDNYPTTDKEIKNQVPTPSFINYLNTGESGSNTKEKTPDGKTLLIKWISSDTMTANDIDSIYSLSDKDGKGWKFWNNDEKRSFAFKLAPEADGVKTFDGKDIISLDLNDVSIQTASLAGNTGLGVFLNGIKMSVNIIGTTLVVLVLFFSVIRSLIKSFSLFITNLAISGFAVPTAILATVSVMVMLLVSIVTAGIFVALYSQLVDAIDELVSDALNKNFDFGGGIAKQTILTGLAVLVQWIAALFVFKGRGAITTSIEQFFGRLMDRMGMQLGLQSTGGAGDPREALGEMAAADKAGSSGFENQLSKPLDKGKEALESLPETAKGLAGSAAKSGLDKLRGNGDDDNSLNGNISSEESVDGDEQGESVEKSLEDGLNAMGAYTERGLNNNLDDQDSSISDAISANDDLKQAEDDLQDAKDNYEALERAGASPETLADAQKDIDNAQANYDNALGNSQEAARNMAGTGVTAEGIANAKEQSARDFAKASTDVQNAQQELDDLQGQRQQLEKAGASQNELENMDDKIANAQERVNGAKDRQQLAEDAYRSNVGNLEAEKDARNDLLSAQQGERAAQRNLANAERNGNLEHSDKTALRNTAQSMSQNIEGLKSEANEQLSKAESAQGALNYMEDNGGKAFSDSDKNYQSGVISNAGKNIDDLKGQISQANKQGASADVKKGLNTKLQEAQSVKSGAETVMGAIDSGKASQEAIAAQSQIVDSASNTLAQAESQVAQLKQRENAGEMIPREEMNNAQQNLRSASQTKQQASRILSGLHAQSVVGSNEASPQRISEMKASNDNQLRELKGKTGKFEQASKAINEVANGGNINKENTASMMEAQKIAQSQASQRTTAAKDNLDNIQSKLGNLKQQQANGKPVTGDIKRMTASAAQASKQYEKAKGYEDHVKSQGSQIRSAGRKMVENTTAAKDDLAEQQRLKANRKSAHDNILKSGGYTKEQLQTLKDEITSERSNLESNSRGFRNDRKDKLANVQMKLNKSEQLFNSTKDN